MIGGEDSSLDRAFKLCQRLLAVGPAESLAALSHSITPLAINPATATVIISRRTVNRTRGSLIAGSERRVVNYRSLEDALINQALPS